MRSLENFLNDITMYRLMLYCLIALSVLSLVFSALGLLPFNPVSLIVSSATSISVCLITNILISKFIGAETNIESAYISALILVLIMTPSIQLSSLEALALGGFLAMVSKYILSFREKHLFNPAALSVAVTSFVGHPASWWIGTSYMVIPTLLVGILIVKKVGREEMLFCFFFFSLIAILAGSLGFNPLGSVQKTILETPILFFAFVMLTEPLTTPPTKTYQAVYGGLVGVLFAPQIHLGPIYSTPELALLVGNLFSFWSGPKGRFVLVLKERRRLSDGIYDFVFSTDRKIPFKPGQYLEWTLPHSADTRGVRRYFTIASSPTEGVVRAGVRFYERSSSFKEALLNLKLGEKIVSSSLYGDFTLPDDPTKGLVFLAGGVGITPFRAMIKYLVDKVEKRDITLFYSVKHKEEIAYRELFEQAKEMLGIKTVYILTQKEGRLSADRVAKEVEDYPDRLFYLSGPLSMVSSFKQILKDLRVPSSHIRTDYFPGFKS